MTVPELVPLHFDTDSGCGWRARIGLIVLASDQTLEAEARRLRIDGVDFYHCRIPMETEVTPAALTAMEQKLPAAARLLPPEFTFGAIGYGCTSAATLIGSDGITAAIQAVHPGMRCSDPIAAAVAAFSALGSRSIAVVTPYTAGITAAVARHFAAAGFEVSALGSFLEASERVVARISPQSIAAAVRAVAGSTACDAVFVSCTNLRACSRSPKQQRNICK